MSLDPADIKVKWAVDGREAELWLESPVGDYVLKRFREEREKASERLETIDSTRWQEIVQIQAAIKAIDLFINCLGEVIHAGRSAQEEIRNAAS